MISTFSTLGHDFIQETPHCAWAQHKCEDPAHCNGSAEDYDFFLLAVSDTHEATDGGTSMKGLFYIGSLRASAPPDAIRSFAQRIEDIHLELKLLIMIHSQDPREILMKAISDAVTGELEVTISMDDPLQGKGFEKIFAPKKSPLPPT